MSSPATRDQLRERAIVAFAARPEVYKIVLFGKEVRGAADCYSDLDMIVLTSDLAKTQSEYRLVFESISPIRAVFPLAVDQTGYTEMIILRDWSPYQKVDFSFHAELGERTDFGPFLTVYDDQRKPCDSHSLLAEPPIRRDVAYCLSDVLFSVGRFIKCLFRGDTDMYRRWKGTTDATLVLLFESYFGWEAETTRRAVSAPEWAQLAAALDEATRRWIGHVFPVSATLDVAASYQASVELYVALARQKATHLGVALDEPFISYIARFLATEIERFRTSRPATNEGG